MALSGSVVFAVVFIGCFAILFSAFMMTPFYVSSLAPTAQNEAVRKQVELSGLIVYDNYGDDNITGLGYTSLTASGIGAPQWKDNFPSGHYLEVWYDDDNPQNSVFLPTQPYFELRLTQNGLIPTTYTEIDQCKFYNSSGLVDSFGLTGYEIYANYNSQTNSSAFSARAAQISTSLVIMPYHGLTMLQSLSANKLQYFLSFDVSTNQTSYSAWSLITDLLTFKAPQIGIPDSTGMGGAMIDDIIALFVWSVLGYLIYKIIAGLIPWLSGGSGD